MDAGAELLAYLNSSDSHLFEYSELEEWYENRERPEISLKLLVNELIKEGKVNMRTVTSGDESCDLYWLCHPQEKKVKQTEDIKGSSTKSNRLQQKRRSHSKFIPPRSAKKPKTIDTSTYASVASTSTGDHSKETLIELSKEKKQLMEKLHEKDNKLQKLRLVKLYRTKNDLTQLEGLISKWRSVSQEAAQALLEHSPTSRPTPSMTELLGYLSISPDIIHYDTEDELFY
ncbi:PREDICTED: swi5-dependent recombination DNA repair protein 1 homolog [Amphimedon queenslandica]|uniref:Swi5-dependent recombination DNA repair protein 1 homolog n=1 Tax=Amphimedon queenslandica TaxID=400682 RepID=A0A1X7TS09_AMPQE|nr:PREDICTED: swi5-dependent recombination DNA repair protein 1 homolog [Amphimedon queenslandica]|eukprot:XP_011406953.1 PREDICTED: swi5-dependent recombination DNA repair protein 1 homolog [Amphimedon queenslandica]